MVQAFKALDLGEREPATKEEKISSHFAVVSAQQRLSLKKLGINIVLVLTLKNVFTPYLVM